MAEDIKSRLEYLRSLINAEGGAPGISYGELAELQSLAEHIDPGDVELLEWAGVPEFPEEAPRQVRFEIPEVSEHDLPDLLRHLAGQIEDGFTEGYHPRWSITTLSDEEAI